MKYIVPWLVMMVIAPINTFAANSVYCPAKQGYINIGMTMDEVISKCGQPMSRQDSSTVQITQKTPVQQLIYTTLNQGAVYPGLTSYYQTWSLPSGSVGASATFNIINNKIASITLNGASANAMSICGGVSLQPGDNVSQVYSACGNPSLVNQTYTTQVIDKSLQPQVWIYQPDRYQPTMRLTFISGHLQSIE